MFSCRQSIDMRAEKCLLALFSTPLDCILIDLALRQLPSLVSFIIHTNSVAQGTKYFVFCSTWREAKANRERGREKEEEKERLTYMYTD